MISSLLLFRGSRQLHFHVILWKQSHISLGWGSISVEKSCENVYFTETALLITSIQPCCAGRSYTVEEVGCLSTWTPKWRGSAWTPAFPGSQHKPASLQSKPTWANVRADWTKRLCSLLALLPSSFSWVQQNWRDSHSGWLASERHPDKDEPYLKSDLLPRKAWNRYSQFPVNNSVLHRCWDTMWKLFFVGTLAAVVNITTTPQLPSSLCQRESIRPPSEQKASASDFNPGGKKKYRPKWSLIGTCQYPLDGWISHVLDVAAPKVCFILLLFLFLNPDFEKKTKKNMLLEKPVWSVVQVNI